MDLARILLETVYYSASLARQRVLFRVSVRSRIAYSFFGHVHDGLSALNVVRTAERCTTAGPAVTWSMTASFVQLLLCWVAGSARWCADTAMSARIALSLFVLLKVVRATGRHAMTGCRTDSRVLKQPQPQPQHNDHNHNHHHHNRFRKFPYSVQCSTSDTVHTSVHGALGRISITLLREGGLRILGPILVPVRCLHGA